MSLKYSLIPNHLTDDPDDYMGIVQDQQSYTIEDIIDIMIGRGSTVTKAEALSVIEEYEAAIEQILARGGSVNTSLFRTKDSIAGVFTDKFDTFDPSRHYIRRNLIPGHRIGGSTVEMPVEKVSANQIRPVLEYFRDFTSGTKSETLTPGGTAEIRGSHLKIDPEDPDQGIYFLGSDDAEHKVELIMRNMPAHLMFEVPAALTSGEYEVEVRNQQRGTHHHEVRPLKCHTGRFLG
jgi:hypothetical protein